MTDDGNGFDTAAVEAGLGMTTLRSRARAIGAELGIHSRPGRTRVKVVAPLPANEVTFLSHRRSAPSNT
ncbi:MAG: hypothetical protein ACOC93_02435 [Planctomycetota bacterium]